MLVLLIGNVFLIHYDNIFNWILDCSRTECADIGGTNSGTCAEGFGICCTSKLSCVCKKAMKLWKMIRTLLGYYKNGTNLYDCIIVLFR